MRFNSVGDAATGFTQLGVNGAAVPGMAALTAGFPAGPSWYTDDTLFFQYTQAGVTRIGLYDTVAETLTPADSRGANFGAAGGGVWIAWISSFPTVRTSVSGFSVAGGGVLDVNLAGQMAILGSYGQGTNPRVYTAAGTLLRSYSVKLVFPQVTLRGDYIAYNNSAGWYLANTATGAGIPYLQRPMPQVNWVIPMDDAGTLWVVERTGDLWVREPSAAVAYNLAGLQPPGSFNPDAMMISPGVMRIGWCRSASEAPGTLVVVDLTLATGDTSIGTVTGAGVLSFSAGPTLVPEAITTGGGTTTGGGGGGTPVAGGPSTNAVRRITRPTLPKQAPRKTYPHVAEIGVRGSAGADIPTPVRDAFFAAQQSTRLLWDLHGTTHERLTAFQASFDRQATTNADLRKEIEAVREEAKQALAVAGKLTALEVPIPTGPTNPPPDDQVGGPPVPPPGGGAVVVPGTADAINAQDVTWMTTNPANWPIGATITNVQITAAQICLDYTGKNVWPAVDPSGDGVLSPGNPWVIAFIGGQYYGSTYEWLRVGQICKSVTGPEFQDYVTGTSPLDTWAPALGETVWFMVSSLARSGPQSPVNQRTQIVAVTWPF